MDDIGVFVGSRGYTTCPACEDLYKPTVEIHDCFGSKAARLAHEREDFMRSIRAYEERKAKRQALLAGVPTEK